MEIMRSGKQLDFFLESNNIRSNFSTCEPDFMLLHYKKGEFLASPNKPIRYVQFLVSGKLRLFTMPTENNMTVLQTPFYSVSFIGDMELIFPDFVPEFIEAETEVYTVGFSLNRFREELLADRVFLRFICEQLATKLRNATNTRPKASFREQINSYLEFINPSDPITNISGLAQAFNVTNRHMLRALKGLTEDGVLSHPEKGVYYILDLSKRKY